MTASFLTLPAEVIGVAGALVEHLRSEGFNVKVEPMDVSYPHVPAVVAKQRVTTIIFDVSPNVVPRRVSTWALYARSCPTDVRIAVCIPEQAPIRNSIDSELRRLGVGLYRTQGTEITEVIAPKDLGVNLSTPVLAEQPAAVRRLLGPAFRKLRGSDWRDGFEDACGVLQEELAEYLIRGVRTGRLSFLSKRGKPVSYSNTKIRKLTLGGLRAAIGQIAAPNETDSQVERALKRLNPDRITSAHHRRSRAAEKRLRNNVALHLWVIVGILQQTKRRGIA